MGSIFTLTAPAIPSLPGTRYVVFVILLHPAASNWEVSSEIPSICCLHLITSRWLVVVTLLQSGDVGGWMGLSIIWFFESIREKSTSSSSNAGYHGWDLNTGAKSIRDALSSLTFLRYLPMRQKGGKAYPSHLSQESCSASIPTSMDLASYSQNTPAEHWVVLQTGIYCIFPESPESAWILLGAATTLPKIELSWTLRLLCSCLRCSAVSNMFLSRHHCHGQGRSQRSGRSGFGLTTFY